MARIKKTLFLLITISSIALFSVTKVSTAIIFEAEMNNLKNELPIFEKTKKNNENSRTFYANEIQNANGDKRLTNLITARNKEFLKCLGNIDRKIDEILKLIDKLFNAHEQESEDVKIIIAQLRTKKFDYEQLVNKQKRLVTVLNETT